MSLSQSKVGATIAVSDMARARRFYEGVLKLEPAHDLPGGADEEPGGVVYACGEGTSLLVYVSEYAGTNRATVATWEVPDLDAAVDELAAAGAEFESYGPPMQTDERGIHTMHEGRIAWLRDPDGNTISIGEFD
jgi:catechol 2,3-dioxygenase-like lactoylglutathione lyase family enzyme